MTGISHKYQELLKGINLNKGMNIGSRTFIGPKEVMEQAGKLEDLYNSIKKINIFRLYNESISHDGLHDEDIYQSGRYYAYLVFELKGQSQEEKTKILKDELKGIIEKHGEESVLKYFPTKIKGRQVTQNLSIRPEDDDYPSNYSKTQTEYAKKMAKEEIPGTVLEKIKDEQDALLNQYEWYTLFVENETGKLINICNNVYLVSESKLKDLRNYEELWECILEKNINEFYDFNIATDGEFPQDAHNSAGRFYAYANFELKGQSKPGKKEFLKNILPEKMVKNINLDILSSIFPMNYKGDLVTEPLTLRPEEDEYPSHFNERKIERGKKKGYNQILYNIQAEIIRLVEGKLKGLKKIIILTK
jgi:hypothetical protein